MFSGRYMIENSRSLLEYLRLAFSLNAHNHVALAVTQTVHTSDRMGTSKLAECPQASQSPDGYE